MSPPCKRWPTCANTPPHDPIRHDDPRDDLYNGPHLTLQTLPPTIRKSARKIIRDAPTLTPEVIDLANHINHLRTQITHIRADKDQAVQAATTRASHCNTHTETIKNLQTQICALEASLDRTETARLTLLGLLHAIDETVKTQRPDITTRMLYTWLARASRKTHAAHTRAWSGTKSEPGPS